MKWVLKVIIKVLIARIPLPYRFWKSIGAFRHGRMDSSDYPIKIFNLHLNRSFPRGLPRGSVILELGPGDSTASAFLGYVHGAKLTYLVDVGCYARQDVTFYRLLAKEMAKKGYSVPDLSLASTFEMVLQACNARYLTEGLSSLRTIPSQSVDFVWSHSVLEHVRKEMLLPTLHEIRRIMKPGALSSHNIDYQDHLDFSLNSLRFSERVWESSLFVNSGFYTNRVPAVCMHRAFEETGFEILREQFGQWPALPIPRQSIHRDFCGYTDEELLTRTSHVLLKL
jgi:hypothetical protein